MHDGGKLSVQIDFDLTDIAMLLIVDSLLVIMFDDNPFPDKFNLVNIPDIFPYLDD